MNQSRIYFRMFAQETEEVIVIFKYSTAQPNMQTVIVSIV